MNGITLLIVVAGFALMYFVGYLHGRVDEGAKNLENLRAVNDSVNKRYQEWKEAKLKNR